MGLIALVIGHSSVKICGTANKMGYGNITTVDEAIDTIKGKYYHRMLAEWGQKETGTYGGSEPAVKDEMDGPVTP